MVNLPRVGKVSVNVASFAVALVQQETRWQSFFNYIS
jgi:hypothetical protein